MARIKSKVEGTMLYPKIIALHVAHVLGVPFLPALATQRVAPGIVRRFPVHAPEGSVPPVKGFEE